MSIVFGEPEPAYACSCEQPKSAIESLSEYDAVFSGKVIGLERSDFDKILTFDVDRAWKGITNEPVRVATGAGGADCGYPFEESSSYLVYAAIKPNGVLSTTYCTRTALLDSAEADPIVLCQGDVSCGASEAAYEPSFRIEHPILLVATVGFAAAVIGIFVIARRKGSYLHKF